MADPITATIIGTIAIACGTVELANSITEFLKAREERERVALQCAAEYRAVQERAARDEAAARRCANPQEEAKAQKLWKEKEDARRALRSDVLADEMLFVLAVLGQRLFQLEVVAFEHIPSVLKTVDSLWPGERWKIRFNDKLDASLKYAVVAAMGFCAECWPMHIYRGFGAPVLNDFL